MNLVAIRDADELLVQEMLAPLPLEQARSSLEFWRERRKVLPFHRRRERREADEMIHRWRARVAAAERARFGTGLFGQIRRRLALEPPTSPDPTPAVTQSREAKMSAFGCRRIGEAAMLGSPGKPSACQMRRYLLSVEWQHGQFGRRTADEAVDEQEVFGLFDS